MRGFLLVASLLVATVQAADLPEHRELRILIVSDRVNPHGLADDQLTEPGELGAALTAPQTGLHLSPAPDAVLEIPTDSIELATVELLRPPADPLAYDVLIYFAHRIPTGADAVVRQEAFADATRQFLERGGGVVAFHHGLYVTTGKESMAFLLGAAATGSVVWDTFDGQSVIAVAPEHFVACNGVDYAGTRSYQDPALAIPLDDYPVFENVPDERYPQFVFLNSTETVEILFGSDYQATSHLLGYTHRRAGWDGLVVAYQPGEHEPTALDPAGPNFQILLNTILYAAHRVPRDGIALQVSGDVTLSWSACSGDFLRVPFE